MTALTPDDDACLRMLAGAHFGPDAKLTLPSGREIGPEEAQALTGFYARSADRQDGTGNGPHSTPARPSPSHTCTEMPESSTATLGLNPDQDGRETIAHNRPSTDDAWKALEARRAQREREILNLIDKHHDQWRRDNLAHCDICGKPITTELRAHFDGHTWFQRTFWPITTWWNRTKARR